METVCLIRRNRRVSPVSGFDLSEEFRPAIVWRVMKIAVLGLLCIVVMFPLRLQAQWKFDMHVQISGNCSGWGSIAKKNAEAALNHYWNSLPAMIPTKAACESARATINGYTSKMDGCMARIICSPCTGRDIEGNVNPIGVNTRINPGDLSYLNNYQLGGVDKGMASFSSTPAEDIALWEEEFNRKTGTFAYFNGASSGLGYVATDDSDFDAAYADQMQSSIYILNDVGVASGVKQLYDDRAIYNGRGGLFSIEMQQSVRMPTTIQDEEYNELIRIFKEYRIQKYREKQTDIMKLEKEIRDIEILIQEAEDEYSDLQYKLARYVFQAEYHSLISQQNNLEANDQRIFDLVESITESELGSTTRYYTSEIKKAEQKLLDLGYSTQEIARLKHIVERDENEDAIKKTLGKVTLKDVQQIGSNITDIILPDKSVDKIKGSYKKPIKNNLSSFAAAAEIGQGIKDVILYFDYGNSAKQREKALAMQQNLLNYYKSEKNNKQQQIIDNNLYIHNYRKASDIINQSNNDKSSKMNSIYKLQRLFPNCQEAQKYINNMALQPVLKIEDENSKKINEASTHVKYNPQYINEYDNIHTIDN